MAVRDRNRASHPRDPPWYLIFSLWKLHRDIENRLELGAAAHPEIAQKLAEFREKQREYEEALKKISRSILFHRRFVDDGHSFGACGDGQSPSVARAARLGRSSPRNRSALRAGAPRTESADREPLSSSLANDEVLYLGGWANVPDATVKIYIERTETGDTYEGTATTGSDGNWFYSFPQLFDSGHYVAWAELSSGNEMSPPSGRVDVLVAPTAIEIGATRLSYEELYLALFAIFLIVALVLFVILVRYLRRVRSLRAKLEADIEEAEASLRRGFSVLQKDIEQELAYIQRMKGERALSQTEREREDKVKRDLAEVSEYIGKEIWKIEEEEKKFKL